MNEHGTEELSLTMITQLTWSLARLYLPTLPRVSNRARHVDGEDSHAISVDSAHSKCSLPLPGRFASTHGPICRFLSQPPQKKNRGGLVREGVEGYILTRAAAVDGLCAWQSMRLHLTSTSQAQQARADT